MKKKIIIPIIVILVLLVTGGIILFTRKYSDENTLYFVKFNDTILRFEHMDHVVPQNQIVAVQRSTNNGRTFETITEGQVIVSLEPKFVFLNEKLGFAVKKPNNIKDNGKYFGMYVTTDGGKTFNQSEITYDNPNISILTIEDVPFYENNKLKLHCSIYQAKDDGSGYETVDLYFITDDDGLNWYLENETKNDEIILLGDPPSSVDSSYLYWIKINKKEACKNDINLYMKNNNNNIYYFCINELFVSFNPNLSSTPTLKMLVSWGNDINKTINDITSKMSIKEQYRDGGSIMYERESLRILKCNTVDGNKDIYIGYDNLEYKDGYCIRGTYEEKDNK